MWKTKISTAQTYNTKYFKVLNLMILKYFRSKLGTILEILLYTLSVMYSPGPVNLIGLNSGLTGKISYLVPSIS